ncbi:MAG: hypothetical protein CVU71_14795 [Deltaproteobacteria bacterium HGW-Deltaproteobacteria-6]|nr:MAG: hypothetical protein CVU71_14795 [Deltaproteobacteria bacterium HGW-Deltaproteobacteria-6]
MCDVAFNTVLKFIPEIGEAYANTRIKYFAISSVKQLSVMRFGHSVTPKLKMFLKTRKTPLVMVTFGHGLRLTRIKACPYFHGGQS